MNLIAERELQATIIEACETLGLRVFHVHDARREVQGRSGRRLVGDAQAAGYPDLTIAGNGRTVWAELKSGRGKLEPEQAEWLDMLPAHQSYVWQPRDLDLALRIVVSGHPADGSTCWTCRREEILERVGIKRKTGGAGPAAEQAKNRERKR